MPGEGSPQRVWTGWLWACREQVVERQDASGMARGGVAGHCMLGHVLPDRPHAGLNNFALVFGLCRLGG